MTNWTEKWPGQNEANFRTDGNGQGPAWLPVPLVGPFALNKANLPTHTEMDAGPGGHRRGRHSGSLRQTNPICRRRAGKTIAKAGGLDDATRQGTSAPNKPNLPGTDRKRRRLSGPQLLPPVRAVAPNKPNSSGATSGTSTVWRKSYDELDLPRASERQSQFAGSGRCDGSGIHHRMPGTPRQRVPPWENRRPTAPALDK
jgi:hypothetical protein